MQNKSFDDVAAAILGHAVGDALGVPVEFESRAARRADPVVGMRGFGTHNQPPGTWSDDTSLALCLVESLCERGMDYDDLGRRFVGWLRRAHWTPHGTVFDVGIATRQAIARLGVGIEPTVAGGVHEHSNGNGSLMRILPIALYLAFAKPDERIEAAMACSRLTHGHLRSQLACSFFVETCAALVRGLSLPVAVTEAQRTLGTVVDADRYCHEQSHFTSILSADFSRIAEHEIASSGYVMHTLEASLWCALTSSSFAEGVLKAVNLGDDTDTTGAVTSGLLGLHFGLDAIPHDWMCALARRDELVALSNRFAMVCSARWESDKARIV